MTVSFTVTMLQQELLTAWVGRACRVETLAASTIDLAWEWLRSGGPEGGVVIALRQTRGRGRLGRPWFSPEGGLWMSVIARPDLEVTRAGRLGVGMALAAADAVAGITGSAAEVKWPNDIVFAGRKVGGVLVETETSAGRVQGAVLSLGLNVNVDPDALPAEVREAATSLTAQTGRNYPLQTAAARVLENLERLWPEVLAAEFELAPRWRERDALLGLQVTVEAGEAEWQGEAAGIDEEGGLVLLTTDGPRKVRVGEIRALRSGLGWTRPGEEKRP